MGSNPTRNIDVSTCTFFFCVFAVLCRYRPFDGPVKEFEESSQTYEEGLWFKNLNKSTRLTNELVFRNISITAATRITKMRFIRRNYFFSFLNLNRELQSIRRA